MGIKIMLYVISMALARFQVDTGSISGLGIKLFQDSGKCDFCIEKTIF